MKKISALTSAALLLLSFGPLAHAARPAKFHAPRSSFGTTSHTTFRPAVIKTTTTTTHTTFSKPIHHAPIVHAPFHHAPIHHAPIVHAPKHSTFVKPFVHAPKGVIAPKVVTGYAKLHGVKFTHGVYYTGKFHRHWTKRVWLPRYGTYGWFCPATSAWYYWYGPKAVYYPMSYISVAKPVAATPATAVVPPGGEELPEVPAIEAEGPVE